MAQKLIARTVTGENQFSDPAIIVGYFNVSISGTWTGTVTCQRSFDSGSTWFDVKDWDSNVQEFGFEPENNVQYRIGVKFNEYTSGPAVLRLSQ